MANRGFKNKKPMKTENENKPVDYSLFIKYPSPDLQEDPEYMKGKEVLNVTAALKDIDGLLCEPITQLNAQITPTKGRLAIVLPPHVAKFLIDAIKGGSYRVELLDGETEYKLYKKYKGDGTKER